MPKRKTSKSVTLKALKSLLKLKTAKRKTKTKTKTKTTGRGFRGKGIRDWFKKAYSWAKDKASSLWNNNKGMLQQQALRLANQAKDKAIQYAQEKKLLSNAVNKILPGRYGIDKIASSYVAQKTGMGRKRRVGRPKKYGGISYLALQQQRRPHTFNGRGFFGNLWSGVKDIGGKIVAPVARNIVVPLAQKALTSALVGGKKKKTTRRRTIRGRGMFGSVLGGLLPF